MQIIKLSASDGESMLPKLSLLILGSPYLLLVSKIGPDFLLYARYAHRNDVVFHHTNSSESENTNISTEVIMFLA